MKRLADHFRHQKGRGLRAGRFTPVLSCSLLAAWISRMKGRECAELQLQESQDSSEVIWLVSVWKGDGRCGVWKISAREESTMLSRWEMSSFIKAALQTASCCGRCLRMSTLYFIAPDYPSINCFIRIRLRVMPQTWRERSIC